MNMQVRPLMQNLFKLLLLFAIIFNSSCSDKFRARRLFDRAIKLDPSIIQRYDTTIVRDTFVIYDKIINVPGNSTIANFKPNDLSNLIVNGQTLKVIDDSIGTVEIKKNEDDSFSLTRNNKPKDIPILDTIYLTDTITVPGKLIIRPPEIIEVKGYFHKVGVAVHLLIAIFVIYWIIRKYGLLKFLKF